MKIGLIVNPVAGLGGRVALKGTDGVVEEALRRGAKPLAQERAAAFLRALQGEGPILTCSGSMGETACELAGVSAMIAHVAREPSTAEDTREAARSLLAAGAELLVFVGGDGTARDVLDAVGQDALVLGVPAGVKMYSGCFAATPRGAALLVSGPKESELRDVVDVDEARLQRGELAVTLHGQLRVPRDPRIPGTKSPGPAGELEAAHAALELLQPGTTWLLGPGGTLLEAKRLLGIGGTLLGVDAVRDGKLLFRDAAERDLLALPEPFGIVVSPIGGQGFLLGRGNAPISPAVIRRAGVANVRAVASEEKLNALRTLRIDSGDPDLDASFPEFIRVHLAPGRTKLMRLGR